MEKVLPVALYSENIGKEKAGIERDRQTGR